MLVFVKKKPLLYCVVVYASNLVMPQKDRVQEFKDDLQQLQKTFQKQENILKRKAKWMKLQIDALFQLVNMKIQRGAAVGIGCGMGVGVGFQASGYFDPINLQFSSTVRSGVGVGMGCGVGVGYGVGVGVGRSLAKSHNTFLT
eukprot:TRINITY_DN14296_c0_g1_i2.p3 TRINITY_DN14296_c0_g1~~TRINITY_DN14296_c0_g1_i2.p3  ORF type:complete len:143 (-),score=16.94 TRINITY_DN14296_c0_g1_i2:184-612(-)